MPARLTLSVTPALNRYYPAQEVRVTVEVRDAVSGALTTPASLDLTFLMPDGTEVPYGIGALTNPSTGVYYKDIVLSTAFDWQVRAETATPQGAAELTIPVEETDFGSEDPPMPDPGTGDEGRIARVTGGVYVPYAGGATPGQPLVWSTGTGWIGAAAGTLLAAVAFLAPGTNGQVLTTAAGATTWGQVTEDGIADEAVTLPKLAHIATERFLGRATAGTGDVEALTTAQATALLDPFTDALQGVVPASGGGTTNFLRADGTWAAPTLSPAGSSGNVQYNNGGTLDGASGVLIVGSETGLQATFLQATGGAASNFAGQGALRLGASAGNGGIVFRNNANSGDIHGLFSGTDDVLYHGSTGGTVAHTFRAASGGAYVFTINAVSELTVDASTLNAQGNSVSNASFFSGTGNVSTTGLLRGPNSATGGLVNGRNNVNTANIQALTVASDNAVYVGDSSNAAAVYLIAAGNIGIRPIGAGTDEFTFSTTSLTLYGNNLVNAGFLSANGTAAAAGFVRGLNNTTLAAARNAADSGDIVLLATDGSNNIAMGSGATSLDLSCDLDLNDNDLLGVQTLTGEFFTNEINDGNSSTADTIDWSTGPFHRSTLTGNCTYTFTAPAQHKCVQLRMIQDGTGGHTVTWPASVKWANGAQPSWLTTANAVNVATFFYDGTNYWGVGSSGFA